MGFFGGQNYTGQVTTGNVRTTYDLYNASVPFNNQKCPLGSLIYDVIGADSISGKLTPAGAMTVYKYVLYKSTTNPALLASPGVVYYTDETGTIVSGAMADGVFNGANAVAGYMMPNTTDIAGLTAAILNNGGLGSYVWIAVGGFVGGATAVAATAVGDALIGSATAFTPGRTAAGTAPTNRVLAFAQTAIAGGVSDVMVDLVRAA